MKKHVARRIFGATAALGTLAFASIASAEPILDFTGATAAITAELGPAVTSAMPILGTLLAIGIGYKVYKRFAK